MSETDVRPIPPPTTHESAVFDPVAAELNKCVHCGFCLTACPTYDILREEPDSPRGRIALIEAVEDRRIDPGERFEEHMFLCVGCRACETACPAGVNYGLLLEHARAEIGPPAIPGRPGGRKALTFVFRHILPHPRRVRLLAALAVFYQRSGLQALVRATGLLRRLGSDAARLDSLLPPLPARFFNPPARVPAAAPHRYRVGLLSGCVMGTLFAPSSAATLRLLRRAGCEIMIPRRQTCCGALQVHNGDPDTARELARRNIAAFETAPGGGLDAVIVNAAGCGAAMKEYGHLLAGDPEWAGRATRFAAKVKDITEFLDEVLPDKQFGSLPPQKVTYQDPCHLSHGQGIREAPRRLMKRIRGLELIEMDAADRCCGSAGIYNVIQPEMAERMLAEKMQHIAASGVETVIAPNPGCILQLRWGAQRAGPPVRVEHLVDLLDAAMASEEENHA